jgi:DNA primase
MRSRSRRSGDGSGEQKIELSLIVLAMEHPEYLERYEADNIRFRTPIGRKITGIMRGQDPEQVRRIRGYDSRMILEALDPEEEALLIRALDTIRIGPDEEAFYLECRSKYTLNGYQLRRTELVNALQVAEKVGNDEELQRILQELTRLDEAIRKVRRD